MSEQSIESRVETLERSARRWRVAAVALGASLIAWVGVGADEKKAADAVSARSFTVVNAKGEAVGVLSAEDEGGKLLLKGSAGGALVGVEVKQDGAAVMLHDGERYGVSMRASRRAKASSVRATDLQTRAGAGLIMSHVGARISVAGADGSQALLDAPPKENASVVVQDAQGERLWSEPRRK